MDGILIIDKPAGLTSHDVVARVRRMLHERRVGHTGTLDPFATGVLVLLIGRATRLAQFVNTADKEYEALIRFGYATDTGDISGKTIAKADSIHLDPAQVLRALKSLQGEIEQLPPMYSAKKYQGRRLYEMARRGEQVKRKPVRVKVHAFEPAGQPSLLKDNADGTVDLAVRVVCSAGTYVRALAESVGERLGVPAHLAELRRTRAGAFHINGAVNLDRLKEHVDYETLSTILISPDAALSDMPFLHLSSAAAEQARNGVPFPVKDELATGWADKAKVRMLDDDGTLIGVGFYNLEKSLLHPRVVVAIRQK